MRSVRRFALPLAIAVLAGNACVSHADEWPSRPVTVIVPFGAGGNTDMMARLASQYLADKLGQSFVVENKPAIQHKKAAVDPATLTMQIRADLPSGLQGISPGMFARVWLSVPPSPFASTSGPSAGGRNSEGRIWLPATAIVRRAELTGVYVVSPEGKPMLRQVRLGRADAQQVEILSGLNAGDQVALEPEAAAAAR